MLARQERDEPEEGGAAPSKKRAVDALVGTGSEQEQQPEPAAVQVHPQGTAYDPLAGSVTDDTR
jgi:hypothetical protein